VPKSRQNEGPALAAAKASAAIEASSATAAQPRSYYNPSMSSGLPSYEEAAALVARYAAQIAPPRTIERIPLDLTTERILAQPVLADRDQPPFPRSTRDGYACRAAEASAHRPLVLTGATRAGDPPSGPLHAGSVWEIMTGAPVPAGADAVMMLEHVETEGDTVRLLPPRTLAIGENIVARAAQAHAGDQLLSPGAVIGFAQIALAGSCGYAALDVFARPRVAILSTGDELVPIDANPAPGQIRNSSSHMLAAQVAKAGGDPWMLPVAADTAEALDEALGHAAQADLLLITGGVSAGKFDLVEPALARRGARFHFTGVRIQPGKPLVFGDMPASARANPHPDQNGTKCCFFGLPGNPISSAVTFELFAAPVLAALSGRTDRGPRFALAELSRGVKGKPGLTRFLPAHCTFAGRPPQVEPIEWQGSGDLAAMARSNCFLVVPEETGNLAGGTTVRILLT
jgi:molybdopterin molybdotransferase